MQDRRPFTPDEIYQAIEGARTFAETGSSFGDNFRFVGSGLGKLAVIPEEKRKEMIEVLIRNNPEEIGNLEDQDFFGEIRAIEQGYIGKIARQVGVQSSLDIVDRNADLLKELNVSEDERNSMIREREYSLDWYNAHLEQFARVLLEDDIAPWSIR